MSKQIVVNPKLLIPPSFDLLERRTEFSKDAEQQYTIKLHADWICRMFDFLSISLTATKATLLQVASKLTDAFMM